MMRSMAVSMASSRWHSDKFGCPDKFGGLKLRNRLVGEPDLVEFAAPKQLHDDLEQPFVGREAVVDGAGLSQIVRSDGIGIADHLDIHHLQSALDQHELSPPIGDQSSPPIRTKARKRA